MSDGGPALVAGTPCYKELVVRLGVWLLVVVMALGSAGCQQQSAAEPGTSVRGTVTGRVTGAGGAPVAGAAVLPRSLDDPAKAIPEMLVSTDADGAYQWTL